MFCIEVILYLIVLFNGLDTTFVTVGNYSQFSEYGINSPDCGLRVVPGVIDIAFKNKCFAKKYPNTTYRYLREENATFPANPVQSRIMGGHEVQYGESPFTVYLNEKYFHTLPYDSCSGVLITFEWVLTSASCEEEWGMSILNHIKVYAGSNHRKKGKYTVTEAIKFIKHPNFDNETLPQSIRDSSNIALLKVKDKFEQRKDGAVYLINTICLPGADQWNPRGGERATFYGFGLIDYSWIEAIADWNRYLADILMKAEFELESHSHCKRGITLCVEFNDSYTGPRACPGDFGGPLVQFVEDSSGYHLTGRRAVLIGTYIGASDNDNHEYFKHDCREKTIPDLFWTAVSRSEILDWVFKTIKEN